jgi:uncharacterized tellurite resistance protein B-like protein
MALSRLARILKDSLGSPTPEETQQQKEHAIRLATIAALLEIAYADHSLSMREERHLVEYARDAFGLTEEETRQLIETAEEMRSETIDHWSVTNLLRKNCTLEERISVVKTMWRIVYEDGDLHQYEGYLVRKLADLMGLEHHIMIQAKLEVQKELGRTP